MKKLFSLVALGATSIFASLACAAADADLTTMTGAATTAVADNKSLVLGVIGGMITLAVIIMLAMKSKRIAGRG